MRALCAYCASLCVVCLAVVEMVRSACAEPDSSKRELMKTVRQPATTIEVLRNFKFALDNDLLLREEFYADDNLSRFFAANKISWHEVTPTRTSGYVFTQHSVGFSLIHGAIDEDGNVVANAKKRVGGTINADVTADLIVELFGKPAEVTDPYAADNLQHPTAVLKKTHEFGNSAIEYRSDHRSATVSLRCIFHGDGTLKACGFGNAEK